MNAGKPPYPPSSEGSETEENVTYHRAAEAALLAWPEATAVDVLTATIQAAHGSRGDLRKSRQQAQEAIDALNTGGYVVLSRSDAERAVYRIPNGYGEPTLPLRKRLDAVLREQEAARGD